MKSVNHHFILIAILPILAFMLFSCSFETDNAPQELEGMWHLTSIRIDNDSIANYADKRVFWSFQAKLLQIEDKTARHQRIIYHYLKEGSQLILEKPYRYDRENGDELLTDTSLLTFYGINSLSETFTYRLDGNQLILENGQTKMTFEKF